MRVDSTVRLLDGNVLYALVDDAHVHHALARAWLGAATSTFATCPVTQGTLIRLAMNIGELDADAAWTVLRSVVDHPRHVFWPDSVSYAEVPRGAIMGHRQVTDAYLVALARTRGGRLVTLDRGLAALHPDVVERLPEIA